MQQEIGKSAHDFFFFTDFFSRVAPTRIKLGQAS